MLKTAQVAGLLGISHNRVRQMARALSLAPTKQGPVHYWPDACISPLREALERKKTPRLRPRPTGPEVAERLGISYGRLMGVVYAAQIPLAKEGQHYLWTETAIAEIVTALAQSEAKARKSGKSTREVAAELGLTYQRFIFFFRKHRELVRPARQGAYLRWSESDVLILRKALERTRRRRERREEHELRERLRTLQYLAAAIESLARPLLAEPGSPATGSIIALAKELAALGVEITRAAARQTLDLNTVPSQAWTLARPLAVEVVAGEERVFEARLLEITLQAEGPTRREAVKALSRRLIARYEELLQAPESDPESWSRLAGLLVPVSASGPAASAASQEGD